CSDSSLVIFFLPYFFFNASSTTEIYTLSLHDALPIYLLKFMRASIKMIGVSNLQSFIASMTQKLTLSDISDESKKLCRLDTPIKIGRAVQQECRDRSRMPSSA